MADTTLEFVDVATLRAEAIGEPGQRTFRILVDGSSSSAIMWLEKDQLFRLALAINQLLATNPERGDAASPPAGGSEPSRPTHLEFKVDRVLISHERTYERLIIDLHDADTAEEADPTVRLWGTRPQLFTFADEALRICAAGRPICPLCGAPIDPSGHRCARSNGHRVHDLSDV